MRKQTAAQRRSNRHYRPSRTRNRRSAARKQNKLKRRLGLIGVLLALAVWMLTHVSLNLLIMVSIVILVGVLLLIIVWFVFRYRLTPEERAWQAEQRMELMRMEDTANAIGVRPIEIQDLAHLTHSEFEIFTGALLEAMGVASELEHVGGARDRGIDLRGKNRFGRLLVVQCKHFFGSKITPEKTREFGWALGLHGADEAWFVTTSFFTVQAEDDVRKLTYRGAMVLVDGDKLVTFIREHWSALPYRWQWRLTECMVKRDRE